MARLSWMRQKSRVFGPLWRLVATVEEADEVPAQISRNGIVFVGTRDFPKWLVFDCPCGNGHRIMLNLDVSRLPHWSIADGNRLSIWPSFDYRAAGRRCHYILSRGRMIWIPERSTSNES